MLFNDSLNKYTMSKKNLEEHSTGFETVEHALSKTEQYIEENKKSLTIIVIVIAIVVGGYLLYNRIILGPKEIEAQSQIFRAEQYFEQDSFRLALEGDGDALGFIDVIDEYGITKTANLAHYYAGISYLHLGQYEDAIKQLKQFDSNDKLVSIVAFGVLGDTYVEIGDYAEAITFFEKAANKNKNDLTSPIYLKKAALAYEALKEYSKAISSYEKIQKQYPKSDEARDIDKYIQAAKMKI
jgi:tetratricopeptide (TPR) repeat protein